MTADTAFWNKLAEKYSRQPVENPGAFERKIAITKSRMTPQDVVLDIGCGTGSLALRLAPSGAHIHGLDLSSEMIRIANGKTAAQKVDNVTFHTGPFDESLTTFEAESLDGICAYSLLHLVVDRPVALDRICRLLLRSKVTTIHGFSTVLLCISYLTANCDQKNGQETKPSSPHGFSPTHALLLFL